MKFFLLLVSVFFIVSSCNVDSNTSRNYIISDSQVNQESAPPEEVSHLEEDSP